MIVKLLIGVVVGGLLGYGVYRFIGCSSGSCPITANPWVSTIFGMIVGALLSRAIWRGFVLKHLLGYPNVRWYDASRNACATRRELRVVNEGYGLRTMRRHPEMECYLKE